MLKKIILLYLTLTFAGCSNLWSAPETTEDGVKTRAADFDQEYMTDEEKQLSGKEKLIKDDLERLRRETRSGSQAVPSQAEEFFDEAFVEIIWRVPAQKVTIYHLRFGSSPSNLDHRLRVPVSDLRRTSHPVHGDTYIYKLHGASPKTPTFVTIQAENEHGLSPESAVLEIPAAK